MDGKLHRRFSVLLSFKNSLSTLLRISCLVSAVKRDVQSPERSAASFALMWDRSLRAGRTPLLSKGRAFPRCAGGTG